MAVDGESLKNAKFYDSETGQRIEVTLKVRDIVFFRLLEKIEGAINRPK